MSHCCGIQRKIPETLLTEWEKHVSGESGYGRLNREEGAGFIVDDEKGLLNIPWPEIIDGGGSVPLDLLLATATNPTLEYPSAAMIAAAWNQSAHVDYFRENQKHRIYTFEDQQIKTRLNADVI